MTAATTLPPLAVRATMPSDGFPLRSTIDVCREYMAGVLRDAEAELRAREIRDAELVLGWYYREQGGEIRMCPPRSGIEIRRDIRRQRIRVRRLRKLAA